MHHVIDRSKLPATGLRVVELEAGQRITLIRARRTRLRRRAVVNVCRGDRRASEWMALIVDRLLVSQRVA